MEGVEGGGEGSVQVSQEENRGAAKEEKAKLGQTGSWRVCDDFFISAILVFWHFTSMITLMLLKWVWCLVPTGSSFTWAPIGLGLDPNLLLSLSSSLDPAQCVSHKNLTEKLNWKNCNEFEAPPFCFSAYFTSFTFSIISFNTGVLIFHSIIPWS